MQHLLSDKSLNRKKTKLVQAIFRDASIGIIVVNREGIIQLANLFALDLFGFTEKELAGEKIEILVPVRSRKRHVMLRQKFNENLNNNTICHRKADLKGRRKNGTEFPVEITLSHYKDNGELYIIAYISDITLRKEEEEEIKSLNEKLEDKVEDRTHKLMETLKKLEDSRSELQRSLEKEKGLSELKSRFITMASHEFRTPLSTILSSAYLVEKYCSAEQQVQRKRHLDRIISSVNTLTDILNEFLSVGRIEEGKITVKMAGFNIHAHIQGIINEMEGLLKKGQHISYNHSGEKQVYLDPGILKHIVMNLLSNAIKFSPENSMIRIRTERKEERLLLQVKDQGIGIPKEDLVRLFERFYRGSNVTNIQGTGLGLHIVFKYVELLNGKISCNSEIEKGTEFNIRFKLPGENKPA
ncbi:MAG: PAS domain-containing sensor histidine kinase [Sphingobacteriales bacterium UTBCD1]|jgi:PAS domain S-box-containing protein|nr:MAG: PAS domain-containing sensor histidine kinase [Sphingobacteriales bacterium UTBCD1]